MKYWAKILIGAAFMVYLLTTHNVFDTVSGALLALVLAISITIRLTKMHMRRLGKEMIKHIKTMEGQVKTAEASGQRISNIDEANLEISKAREKIKKWKEEGILFPEDVT
jgi:MFS superfamily sulfate permease-like transporter